MLDIVVAASLLLLLSPLLALVALAIKLDSEGAGVFYSGSRGLQQAPLSHDQVSHDVC